MPGRQIPDEFDEIARLYRPLTGGAPEALGLLDDAAVIPSRPGQDLVVTTDAVVAGVHVLAGEPLDLMARKLLRANLSDLAAKAAEPDGYLLTVAWPHGTAFEAKARFAAGLGEDQARYGVRLIGGDTVSTAGPLTASVTLFGWAPAGAVVRRGGAAAGDRVLVSGTIGDAGLGLRRLQAGDAAGDDPLVLRHRLPSPRLELRAALRAHASAAADVSDGLLADAGHIARASGCGLRIALERLPVSPAASAWLAAQADAAEARVALATSGDDYEIVCTAPPDRAAALVAEATSAGLAMSDVGEVVAGDALETFHDGHLLTVARRGWTHG